MLTKDIASRCYHRTFQTIGIGDDLAKLTVIDRDNECDDAAVDLSDGAKEKIRLAVEDLFRSGVYPGLSFCLRRNGEQVLHRSLGWSRISGLEPDAADIEGVPMQLETPVCLFSASKAVTAMLVHLLAEDGFINLLNPLSYYIPEFGVNGKDKITIYQMLTHRGGVPAVEPDLPLEVLYDADAILEYIYKLEPLCDKGRTQAYHATSSGFLFAKLIQLTTGKTINEYLDEKIRQPLGFRSFYYGVPEADQGWVAHNYVTGLKTGKMIGAGLKKLFGTEFEDAIEKTNGEMIFDSIVPSANLYTSADEMCRFFQVMLDGGSYESKQIFDPQTVFQATQEASRAGLDGTLKIPMRYSAGMMMGGDPVGIWGRNSGRAYGHLGFSNVFSWAGPDRAISVALLTTGKPIIGPHIKALVGMVDTIAQQCTPMAIEAG